MCGIVGILGGEPVADRLLDGLKRLEYRGYDSAGICTIHDDQFDRRRAPGKLKNLAQRLAEDPLPGMAGITTTDAARMEAVVMGPSAGGVSITTRSAPLSAARAMCRAAETVSSASMERPPRSRRGRKATCSPNLAADRYWTDRVRRGAVSASPCRIDWAHRAARRPPNGKPFSGAMLDRPFEK